MAVFPTGGQKMRNLFIVLSMLFLQVSTTHAEVSVGIGISVPGVSIGINMPAYPRLVPVQGYPVYYDPYVNMNYFFYDGLYWVFQGDDWYVSSWYNGPWQIVAREYVPVYVLRIPVRYYRRPPPYFRGWQGDAPPLWGDRGGRDWEQHRKGWDQWDHRSAPPPAPLPSYQRKYSGERYPQGPNQQQSIQSKKYRYQPREPMTQQYFQQQRPQPRKQSREWENKREERGQDRR
jgi:hypothetical protein